MPEANYLVTLARGLVPALATNNNDSSFAAKVPTATPPTNDGVIDLKAGGGVEVPEWLDVYPVGVGSDEDAFSLRVIGWRRLGTNAPAKQLWVPAVLAEVACTLGTAAGVAGTPLGSSTLFADTITIVHEPTITADVTRLGTVEVFNPADNTVAYFRVKLHGVERVEFTFDQTTNSPTMNVLIAYD